MCLLPTLVHGDSLFEISVGSWWKYKVNKGEAPESISSISDAKVIDGVKWYLLVEDGSKYWIRNSEHGQVEAVNFFDSIPEDDDKAEEIVVFKYPSTKGDTWSYVTDLSTYLGMKDVEVPAGRYKCHMYNIQMSETDYSAVCIAEHVGVVFNEVVLNGGKKMTYELISFELK